MKKLFWTLILGMNGMIRANVIELEEYVAAVGKWKSDDISAMMRSDSLLQMGDTRDLIYGMLHYRYVFLNEKNIFLN